MTIPLRVLIAEDNPDDAELMVLHLTNAGFLPDWQRVETEADYLSALERRPGLILSDWSLPHFSGLRALQLLNERGLDIPFIIVSGSIGEETAIDALRNGADDYVLKDRPARLGQSVRRALEDEQLRKERQQAEKALRESEEKLKAAQKIGRVGNWEYDIESQEITWSDQTYELYERDPHKGPPSAEEEAAYYSPEQAQTLREYARLAIETGQDFEYDLQANLPGRKQVYFAARMRPIKDTQGRVIRLFGTVQDITERKQAEEALRQRLAALTALHTVSAALRAAQTRDQALPILLDETLAALGTDAGIIWLYYPDRDELRAAVARGWFQQVSEAPVKPGEGIAGSVFASGQAHVSAEFRNDPAARAATREQIPDGWGGACVPIRTGAITVGVLFVSVPFPRQIAPEQVKLLESLAEMGGVSLHRMSLHEATVRQLDQLQSLHNIDLAITASMDLRTTLNVLLEYVLTQLKVDAANVLLLNPHLQTLEYATGRGFRTDALKNTRLRLGEGYAGRAALERKLVHLPDLRVRKTDFLRSPFFSAEGFVAYFGIPLIAKGQVKGVLEVFHRAPLHGDSAWLNFLETLAGQAAIAIDNAQLFDNLQRSNMDLALAYDATIKGWSRALDLRDRETEGHTMRVTELTERLARTMDISEAKIVHIRRGALLHDIGKMGVPDSILLKPDKLTGDEWVLMRQHPQFAFDMLAPITYLKPALDIPYCHHEKWDGTGYPRGLKGEQIPLAARLFAVVDVWDALRSDRPYRAAWPEEQVVEYIRSQAGTHFDPKAVELFMSVVSEKAVAH